ncbi:MAG: hypothetical protein Q8K98_05365 [Bacteroidota bacterium]|nr:hypothetical protein [Bacteroidota bacterium]
MKKIIIAGIIGGIVITLWGFIAWMGLNFHKDTMKSCPEDEIFSHIFVNSMKEEGVYVIPAMPDSQTEEAQKVWRDKIKSGPIVTIFFHPTGGDPTMMKDVLYGTIINIITAMLAAWILSRSTASKQSYFARVSFVGVLAIFASITIHISNWNWMYFPIKYATAMSADLIIGWILAGLVIAAFIKERP